MPRGIDRLKYFFERQFQQPDGSPGENGLGRAPTRDELITETLLVYKSNIELAQLLADRYGFEALFYWHPMIFTKKSLTPYERQWYEGAVGEWGDFLLAGYRSIESDVFLNQEQRFRYLGTLFDELEDPYYLDAFHLSEDGNLLVAREIAKDVTKLLQGRRHTNGSKEGEGPPPAAATAASCSSCDT